MKKMIRKIKDHVGRLKGREWRKKDKRKEKKGQIERMENQRFLKKGRSVKTKIEKGLNKRKSPINLKMRKSSPTQSNIFRL
jgi:hypothetical protein